MKRFFIYLVSIFLVSIFYVSKVNAYNVDSIRLIKGTFYTSQKYMSVETFKEKDGVNVVPGNRAVIFDKKFNLNKIGAKISFNVKTSIKTVKDTSGGLWGQSIYIMILSQKYREGFVASSLDYIAKLKIINSTRRDLKNSGNAIYPLKGNEINNDIVLDDEDWNEISLVRIDTIKNKLAVYVNGKKIATLSDVPSEFYILLGTGVNLKFYVGSNLRIFEPKIYRVRLY